MKKFIEIKRDWTIGFYEGSYDSIPLPDHGYLFYHAIAVKVEEWKSIEWINLRINGSFIEIPIWIAEKLLIPFEISERDIRDWDFRIMAKKPQKMSLALLVDE